MPIIFFKGDVLPKFKFTIKDEDNAVVDLTTASAAKCFIRKDDVALNKFSGTDTDAIVQTPKTDGRIDYQLPTGGIDEAGAYSGQVKITFATGAQQTERFQFRVEEGLAV